MHPFTCTHTHTCHLTCTHTPAHTHTCTPHMHTYTHTCTSRMHTHTCTSHMHTHLHISHAYTPAYLTCTHTHTPAQLACTHSLSYDPVTNHWAHVSPMLTRRLGVAVAVLDGYLYAIGGSDGTTPLSSVERWVELFLLLAEPSNINILLCFLCIKF